ncbi:hypothetical protein FQA39_LY15488 [Lamprigera yunnana]|nr:hypothetical protein FQA39_LY15488 [Lamprigera yunnana]
MLRNKHLILKAQQMAMNVLNYLGRERDNGDPFIPFTSVMQHMAKACGISTNILTTIKKRFNEAENILDANQNLSMLTIILRTL